MPGIVIRNLSKHILENIKTQLTVICDLDSFLVEEKNHGQYMEGVFTLST